MAELRPPIEIQALVDSDTVIELFANRRKYAEEAEYLVEISSQFDWIHLYITKLCLEKVQYLLGISDPELGIQSAYEIEKSLFKNRVLSITKKEVKRARTLPPKDMEASIELACALSSRCNVIATLNAYKFSGSGFPTLSPKELMELFNGTHRSVEIHHRDTSIICKYSDMHEILSRKEYSAKSSTGTPHILLISQGMKTHLPNWMNLFKGV